MFAMTKLKHKKLYFKKSIKGLHYFFKAVFSASFLQKKGMATQPKHKLYSVAESLFTEQGLSCSAISLQLGITEATLSKWRNRMDWDSKRDSIVSTPAKIRELLLEEMKSVSSGNKAKIDADALSKINKALSYLDGKVSLSIVISVFMEFDNWMAEADPKKAVDFTEYHKLFIAYRAEQDSLK